MSKVTELASAQLSPSDSVTIELGERDGSPAIVKITWPDKPTVIHPRRFTDFAATAARLFAEAHTRLAQINARGRL